MKSIKILYSSASKTPVWLACSLPGIYFAYQYFTDKTSYGQFIHSTGDWSIGFMAAAMLVTPLRRLFPINSFIRALIFHRRALGVASFGYAAMHTAAYVERKWGADLIIKEGLKPELAS